MVRDEAKSLNIAVRTANTQDRGPCERRECSYEKMALIAL